LPLPKKAKVLLLDEPTSGLIQKLQMSFPKFKELSVDGTAILMATMIFYS
jgi:ABC-type branched-subunit amino acid transport system ATPase component